MTQISLILLLFGNLTGDYALLADVGARAVRACFAAGARLPPAAALLVDHGGRGVMCALALAFVFPLCCLRRIRQVRSQSLACLCHNVPHSVKGCKAPICMRCCWFDVTITESLVLNALIRV